MTLNLTIITVIGCLLLIAMSAYLLFRTDVTFFEIGNLVKVSEDERQKITLAQILLGSDLLAYSDENKVHRGIFDKNKLDNLKQEDLFKEIGYPDKKHFIKIEDLENKKAWKFGDQPIIYREKRNYPVAIRYPQSDVHIGLIYVGWS